MTARRGSAVARVGALAALALLVLLTSAAPASATAYRYWVYWHGTSAGGWTFSPVGGTYVPPDGAVEGWRFGVSAEAGTLQPRAAASYASVCGTVSPPAGKKRVALVVDYGTTADAPPGESPPRGVDTFCAEVASSSNAVQVISAYSSVRTESGLVCGIDRYPAQECGVAVQATPKPTPKPTTTKPTPTPRPATSGPSTARPSSSTGPGGTGSPVPSALVPPGGSSSSAPSAGPTSSAPTAAAPADQRSDGTGPSAVAVGPGGLDDGGTGSSGPPLAALLGGALVVAVGGAAAWRATHGGPRPQG